MYESYKYINQNRPYNTNSILSPTNSSLTNFGGNKTRDPFVNSNNHNNTQPLNQTELNITPNNERNKSFQYKPLSGNQFSRHNTQINNKFNTNNSERKLGYLSTNPKQNQSTNQNSIINTIKSSKLPKNNLTQENTMVQNISINSIKEENERLKLSNAVLTKSNLELKNQIRILQIELSTSNPSNSELFSNRIEQDPQLSLLLQNLKSSLATSQSTNQDLTAMFEGLQKKNSDLTKENLIFKEQIDLANKELENFTKRFSDTRYSIDELTSEIRRIENEKSVLLIHKNDFEEKYKLADEKVENLISINESHIKCKNDNLEMIENLKHTIESLKRNNNEIDFNKNQMQQKIEEVETVLNERSYNMENLQNKIKNFESDREYYNQELKILDKEIKEKDRFIESLQQKFHEKSTDFEKAKSKIEALNINISERDLTIENLKSSIGFISTTIEEYRQDYENIRLQTDGNNAEKSKLIKDVELYKKKYEDINIQHEMVKKDKEILQKRNIELENELNEKKMSLSKQNFEMDVILRKLENNEILLEQMQEELKNSNLNKINEEFQSEINKTNEERNKRIKELEKTINAKNKHIEELQKQIQDLNLTKEEKVAELQAIINKKITSEKELEFKMNDKVNELKNEIEISKQEVMLFKDQKEKENVELLNKYNILKADFEQLEKISRLNEKNFQEVHQLKIDNKNLRTEIYFPSESIKNKNSVNSNVNDLGNVIYSSNNNVSNYNFSNISTNDQSFKMNTGNQSSQIIYNKSNLLNSEDILKKIRESAENLQKNMNNGFGKSSIQEKISLENKVENNNNYPNIINSNLSKQNYLNNIDSNNYDSSAKITGNSYFNNVIPVTNNLISGAISQINDKTNFIQSTSPSIINNQANTYQSINTAIPPSLINPINNDGINKNIIVNNLNQTQNLYPSSALNDGKIVSTYTYKTSANNVLYKSKN